MSNDLISDIIDYEEGDLDEQATIAMFQQAVNDGTAWRLQGSFGRTAMDLIEAGLITLGEHPHRDFYGNYIPSKYDVLPGTKGSQEYVDERSQV